MIGDPARPRPARRPRRRGRSGTRSCCGATAQPFGKTDPQFGLDVGFFVFTLPWLTLRRRLPDAWCWSSASSRPRSPTTSTAACSCQARAAPHHPAARVHLSILARGARPGPGRPATGSTATRLDHQATRPDHRHHSTPTPTRCCRPRRSSRSPPIMCAADVPRGHLDPVLAAADRRRRPAARRRRSWSGGIYPALIQSLQGQALARSRSRRRTSSATSTRPATAYGLADVGRPRPTTPRTTADPGPAARRRRRRSPASASSTPTSSAPTFKQLQAVKRYYQFPDTLDVDRYTIDGKLRDTVIAVRELDLDGVPDGQRNWLNDHTVYTHGYGVVAAYGNQRGRRRQAGLLRAGHPVRRAASASTSRGSTSASSPRTTPSSAAPTGSAAAGVRLPRRRRRRGQAQHTTPATAASPIGSLARKARLRDQVPRAELPALRRGQRRLPDPRPPHPARAGRAGRPVADARRQRLPRGRRGPRAVDRRRLHDVRPTTRTRALQSTRRGDLRLAHRALAARCRRSAPARSTTSATRSRPPSTPTTARCTLYAWDDQDPMLKAWMQAFPGTVAAAVGRSRGDLMAHLRYPEDLFKVQRELLARYHVTDPGAFYGGQDFWTVPDDPTQEQRARSTSRRTTSSLAMPGQADAAFSLTTTFMPSGDRAGALRLPRRRRQRRQRRPAATGGLRPAAAARAAHGQRRQGPGPGAERHLVLERPTARGSA